MFSHSSPGTNGAIFLFDTSNPSVAQRELDPTPGSARDSVSIGGNTVAWQDRTAGLNAQLVVYDLVTGTTTALTNDGATMANLTPDVSPDGKVVAWLKCQPNGSGCQVWDATQDAGGGWTSRQLTFGSLAASHPATNGRIVVYALGQAGTDGAIDYQPVLGGAEQTITVPVSGLTEANPAISGDLVAFDGFTPGTGAIWVADLLAGTVYQVSPVQPQTSTLTDISLAADGTVTVVWQTLESGQYNVHGFRYQLDRTAPLLTLPSNMTVTATSAAGAVVNYTVTASDPDNATSQLTVSCTPASGTIFPVGTTTVTCTASDPELNSTTGSFNVTVVVSAAPTLTTQATSSANTIGTISDTATLSGGNAPTGAITFKLFGPDNATCSGAPVFGSSKPVNGNGNYTSDPFKPFAPVHPGTYRWVASYSGDANNNAAMTACNDLGETSAVTQASPGDLSTVIGQLLAAGCIDNAGIANALTAKLAAAQSAINAGNLKTAINILSAFIDQVRAQSAKHILASCTLAGVTFDPAAVLIADARSIIDSLAVSATPNPITGSVVTATGSGISGATLSLVDLASGKTLASATTDVTGFCFFPTTGLLSTGGTYSVSVTGFPAGFTSSSPAQMFTWTGSPISFSNFTLT